MSTYARIFYVILLPVFITGCLGAKDGSSDSSSTTSPSVTSIAQSVSSQSALSACDNSSEGALVYDRSQGIFYVCDSGNWTSVNLQGPQGAQGVQGATGATGASGANGSNGTNGTNGTNGADGNGMGLVLRDGSNVIKGWFMGFAGIQAAMMRLPNGDMIHIDVRTGKFTGGLGNIFYSGTNCTGDAYAWPGSSSGAHVIGRIYVQLDEAWTSPFNTTGNPIRFFRGAEWLDGNTAYLSRRVYDTQGTIDSCENVAGSEALKMKIVEISAPTSLESLAPITFGL